MEAAVAFEPLSSQGILTAITLGSQAALSIIANKKGDLSTLVRYTAAVADLYTNYLNKRANYYEQETRWVDSIFWHRRRLKPMVAIKG